MIPGPSVLMSSRGRRPYVPLLYYFFWALTLSRSISQKSQKTALFTILAASRASACSDRTYFTAFCSGAGVMCDFLWTHLSPV
eukprot:scaffold41924_cov270-Skeletonema_marinoi.AAC.1